VRSVSATSPAGPLGEWSPTRAESPGSPSFPEDGSVTDTRCRQGSASDANTTSVMGISTLDGLSADGRLAHKPGEFIELDYVPTRIALVAGVVRRIGIDR
jgi:hypothetical protein